MSESAALMDYSDQEWRHPTFGAAHAACDQHAVDALVTLAGKVAEIRKIEPPDLGVGWSDAVRPAYKCACGLSADWFLLEVEPRTEQRERARTLAVSLEGENEKLTRLLTQACGFLVSEDAYDMTELLEEVVEVGIPAYDGVPRCELCGNTRFDDHLRDAILGELRAPYAPVVARADGMVLCQPCEDGRQP